MPHPVPTLGLDRYSFDSGFLVLRFVRDLAATICGVFLFIYGGITVRDATLLAVFFGAGLTLLGLGVGAFRADDKRRDDDEAAKQ